MSTQFNDQQHTLTKAPITPRLVRRKYSNGRVLLTVCKNGYRNSGICAADHSKKAFSTHNSTSNKLLFEITTVVIIYMLQVTINYYFKILWWYIKYTLGVTINYYFKLLR